MIKVENIEVWGFKHAIRGMRNPKNSHSKSDSVYLSHQYCDEDKEVEMMQYCDIVPAIGKNDLDLMHRLYVAGTEHRKFLRQIFVSMDITTNQTLWLEFDTYKIGVTKNSCSKMHRIHVKEFTADDFSHEGIDEVGGAIRRHFNETLNALESLRLKFNETQEKKYWRAIIELLPMGYNLKATVTMNYENVANIIHQRSNHKMFEWVEFTDILKSLPYVKEIMGVEN